MVAPWKAGRWYSSAIDLGGGITNGAGFLVYQPFVIGRAATFDRVGIEVTTAFAASTVKIAAYADDGTGMPGALLADWGAVDSSTTGQKALTINWSPAAGYYHICTLNIGSAVGVRAGTRSWSNVPSFAAQAVTSAQQWNNAGGAAAFPANAPVMQSSGQFAVGLWFRAA